MIWWTWPWRRPKPYNHYLIEEKAIMAAIDDLNAANVAQKAAIADLKSAVSTFVAKAQAAPKEADVQAAAVAVTAETDEIKAVTAIVTAAAADPAPAT